jgi:hypothetical protein
MRAPVALVVATMIGVGVITSCSSAIRGTALDLGQGESITCMPVPREGQAYFGALVITVVSDDPITISAIELVDADSLTLTGAMLMDPTDGVVGYGHEADIPTYENIPAAWDDRVPAVGETLQPGEERNLVLLVETGGAPQGSAVATSISYQIVGRERSQRTGNSLLLSSGDCAHEMEAFKEEHNW